jgi:hypothetical protein
MFKSTGQEEGIVSFMTFMLIFVLPAERKKRKRCTDEGVMDVLFV